MYVAHKLRMTSAFAQTFVCYFWNDCGMTNSQPVSITLSPAQVDQIVRAAAEGSAPGFSTLISTTLLARAKLAESSAGSGSSGSTSSDLTGAPAAYPAPSTDIAENPPTNAASSMSHESPGQPAGGNYLPEFSGDTRLSRSLLRGLSILTCFRPGSEERGILELASELGMSPSTTHRYVATLVELGLLERCPRSRKYRLASA
jgi:hypothetical protein